MDELLLVRGQASVSAVSELNELRKSAAISLLAASGVLSGGTSLSSRKERVEAA
eukprot:CAMPEP_0195571850 /NCGR_PEP_ID=MMETSP0814-20130614/4351_1 /TAXON_ID=97485 /ORGANISM="Prymnesium parvum, Strain Texoma1" /LENGTH=53 /DNA_ID=CAMNT_0040707527 /DNA_START=461 /DNA_END=622 /DNA_ORIENTATION=+